MSRLTVPTGARSLVAAMAAGTLVAGWLAVAGSPAAAVIDWQPEASLAEQTGVLAPVAPMVVSSADGQKLTTVWTLSATDSSNQAQAQTRSSTDGGKTWGVTQNLSEAGAGAPQPSVAASADGSKVTVVYLVPDNQLVAYAYSRTSTDAGATWGAPVNVTPNVGIDGALEPQVASSSDGRTLAVVWVTGSRVWTSISTDGGITWGAGKRLTGQNDGGSYPAVAISDDGTKIAASWNGSTDQGNDLRTTVSVSADTGVTWSAPKILAGPSETKNWGRNLQMSGDGRKLHVLWSNEEGQDSYSVRTVSSKDSGSTWTESTAIGTSKTAPVPTLAASANGSRVYAAWTDGVDATSGVVKVRTSGDAGATWAPFVPLTSGAKFSAFVQLATSGDGVKATAIWIDDQPPVGAPSTRTPVTYTPTVQASGTTDSGAKWEPTATLSSNAAGNLFPRVAMSADGTSMIGVWNRVDVAQPVTPKGAPVDQRIAVLYALGSLTPEPPTPPATKKAQKPVNGKGKPPARIKRKGVTVITGRNARTNAGQMIRTEVRCVPKKRSFAGQTRNCTVIRGPKGKVSVRTYGRKGLKVTVVQTAPATADYKAYRKRTVYINGRKR